MIKDTEKAWFVRVLPDALAFGIGLAVAYFLGWETKDLVWSLWLCSLVLGYLTLLSAIGGFVYGGFWAFGQKDCSARQRVLAILIGIAAGLFFLGFFSLSTARVSWPVVCVFPATTCGEIRGRCGCVEDGTR